MKVTFNKMQIMNRAVKLAGEAVERLAEDLRLRIQKKLALHNSSLTAGLNASPPGMPPGNRTGALMRSITAVDVTTDRFKPHWRVGTKLPYAKIQEFGGRIRPKRVKYLPVPLGPDGARAMKKAKGDLRSLNLTPLRINGKLFLVKWKGSTKRGGAKPVKPLFLLVKSVYLPARPYFRPAIAEQRQEEKTSLASLKAQVKL